jgi:glycosyltransferase involved in cell wall biosynthesis
MAQHKPLHLLIVGDGPEREELTKLIHDLDLTTRVRLLGIRMDIPDLLQIMDVFALSSLSEGMSISILKLWHQDYRLSLRMLG